MVGIVENCIKNEVNKMIEEKNIFITGGAGFIGSTILGKLIDRNQVIVYDNLTRKSLKDRLFRDHPNLKLINGDVLDSPSLSVAMQSSNTIVHCAAIVGIDIVISSPLIPCELHDRFCKCP